MVMTTYKTAYGLFINKNDLLNFLDYELYVNKEKPEVNDWINKFIEAVKEIGELNEEST
jgi:hypothetical protein